MKINIKSLPDKESIMYLYERYYGNSNETSRCVSSHWEKFSKMVDVEIDEEHNITKFFGAGLGSLLYTNQVNRCANYLCNLTYLARLPGRARVRVLCGVAGRNLAAIGSYLSYDFFRQVISFSVIEKHLDAARDDKFNALIIGDGYGFLSSLIKSVYPNCRIVLVDIGKILLFQAVNLQRLFPDSAHLSVRHAEDAARIPGVDFVYCVSEDLELIDNLKFKLVVNIASMQEMNHETIARYFTYARAHGTVDNLFYCCNRERKVLPGGEIIEFLRYPWRDGDNHLLDEQCSFYKYFLTWKPPFVRYFDGPFRHRVTRLAIEDSSTEQAGA